MNEKVVYITPECGEYIGTLEAMSQGEMLTFANNCNEAEVYTLEEFQDAFNSELISDLGFIFFIDA